jgi:hypothetical protein
MTAPLYIRREAYEALPLLKRALIELKIQQGEIAFIEEVAPLRHRCRLRAVRCAGILPDQWRVFLTQYICDRKVNIAGRPADPTQPLHGGNVEYFGGIARAEARAQGAV